MREVEKVFWGFLALEGLVVGLIVLAIKVLFWALVIALALKVILD